MTKFRDCFIFYFLVRSKVVLMKLLLLIFSGEWFNHVSISSSIRITCWPKWVDKISWFLSPLWSCSIRNTEGRASIPKILADSSQSSMSARKKKLFLFSDHLLWSRVCFHSFHWLFGLGWLRLFGCTKLLTLSEILTFYFLFSCMFKIWVASEL